ncbi:VacB/RNase II family 3'-5' exoribonuclease [Arenimonas sp.]|nr:VacB/RNase II family 3'-5' exoribonuclease [Candidatus Parcubacteria bacterium]
MHHFIGQLILNNKGKGFLRKEKTNKEEKDIAIPHNFIDSSLPLDKVEIETFPHANKWGEIEGKVVKIIERYKTDFSATIIELKKDIIIAQPDNNKLNCIFEILNPQNLEIGLNKKILVSLDFLRTPKVIINKVMNDRGYTDILVNRTFYGNVSQVFGDKGENNAEMHSIVADFGFNVEHSQQTEIDAKNAVEEYGKFTEDEISKRLDMRGVWTCTIDPVDAKDFDDALSFRNLPNGNVEIGIHIADVSHFVRPGNALDDEAKDRAFSVYLVDRTIPMLPEVLSNGFCSLNPNENRYAFSTVFEMNQEGIILSRKISKSIIYSDKRFSYEEAQKVLDAGDQTVFPELFELSRFSKILNTQRKNAGAIDFETDEIKFVLDDKGFPVQVYKKERIWTNHLVEEFMLLANKETALYIFTHNVDGNKKLPGVYRVHDLPDAEKILDLSIFVNALGLDFHPKKTIHSRDIQKLLQQCIGLPSETIIKTATLRSMAKAVYQTNNIGHFGLGFEFYTHFTSPIRRYPDLCVHRILAKLLENQKLSPVYLASLDKICEHSSSQEVKAAEAERASTKYKQVEFLSNKIGQEFMCTVSGISDFGVFIQEPESLAEGLIRLRDLGDNNMWEVDKKSYLVKSQDGKKVISLGDTIKVKLRGVDMDLKTIDFQVLM